MTRRFDPPPSRYSELCNRIDSPLLEPPLALSSNPHPLEDYWEDSSVSLRSCHSWEAPSSPWLESPGSHLSPDEQIDAGKIVYDLPSRRIKPCRYSFDASHDLFGSMKSRCNFPPPLASCSTLAIKEGGRFVLKEMDADRPQGFFRAQRGNGRLLLRLVLPDELDEDDADIVSSEDDEDDDSSNEGHGGEDQDGSSAIECEEEDFLLSSKDSSNMESNIDYKGPAGCSYHGDASGSGGVIEADGSEGTGKGDPAIDNKFTLQQRAEVGKALAAGSPFAGGDLAKSHLKTVVEANACSALQCVCSTSQDASTEVDFQSVERLQRTTIEGGISQFLTIDAEMDGIASEDSTRGTLSAVEVLTAGEEEHVEETDFPRSFHRSNIVAGSSLKEQQDLLGVHKSDSMWSVDVANHGLGLSSWSPKQMCVHQSIVNMRPALSLAMS